MEDSQNIQAPTAAGIQDWIVDYIHSVLSIEKADIALDATFDTFAMDSVEAVIMAGMMEEHFLVQIDPALIFEHPTIETLSKKVHAMCAQ